MQTITVSTQQIHYRGHLAALASPRRVHFMPPYDERPDTDPDRRFIYAMGIYARELAAGRTDGPYAQERAELYARTLLIPDDEFAAQLELADEQLAEAFDVPLEQVALKRRDVNLG